jgi:hypothetical protein
MSENELDFDPKRRLCPDGSCVGVMKSDGTCSVCGRDASGAAASTGDETDEPDAFAADDGGGDALPSIGAEGFDPRRRLCDDGSCVGVIGADGRCGVCGQQPAA